MALQKLTGIKVEADPIQHHEGTDDPSVIVYRPARAVLRAMAARLLGLTILKNPADIEAVRQATAHIPDPSAMWTQVDAKRVLAAVGALPALSHAQVWRLDGQGIIMLRGCTKGTKRARKLSYPQGSTRPSLTLLSFLRDESIVIPKGMGLEVPAKLVEDETGLALALFLRKSYLRELTEEESSTSEQEQESATK